MVERTRPLQTEEQIDARRPKQTETHSENIQGVKLTRAEPQRGESQRTRL